MIEIFCDTILPGDATLGAPSAHAVGVPTYVTCNVPSDDIRAFGDLLDKISYTMFEKLFGDLTAEDRLICVEKAKRTDFRLANRVITACFKAYYTNADVLRALSSVATPPFPSGNILNDDDWDILAPVFERGPIYRQVNG